MATSAVLSIGRQLLVIPVPTGPDRDASPVAPCQGRIGVGPFRATAQPTPAPAAPALLRASLRVPRRARAGSILRYQVVLGNPGRAPVDLASACSSYSEAAVSLPSRGHPRGYKALRSYELNCAQGSRIPPGGQRVFAMDLRTTRSRGALRLRLTWSFEPAQSLALTPTSALTATLELEPTRKR
ncbi:MAG: hypothetical protein ACRENV_01760 [Candidatus Dormibacteria bacterium]